MKLVPTDQSSAIITADNLTKVYRSGRIEVPAVQGVSFSVARGEFIAIDTVNSAKDQMAARKLIRERARPNIDKLADPALPLRDCL